jgi:hypothetical protein
MLISRYLLLKYHKEYLKPGDQISLFESQSARELSLIGVMKVNYLKRLESSIKAFEFPAHTEQDRTMVIKPAACFK